MTRTLLAAITLLTFCDAALAQTLEKPECTKANIESTAEKVEKMKDGRNKETAATEIATAKEMLASGKTEYCQNALLKASVQTK